MNKKILILAITAALAIAFGYSARDDLLPSMRRTFSAEGKMFEPVFMPTGELLQLYDMGITDANGDDRLDIYTSAHNYRQNLWLADANKGYQDVLTAWGLDQNLLLPGAEQSEQKPAMNKPGLYIFWQGDVLHLVAHKLEKLEPLKGKIRLYNKAQVMRSNGFVIQSNVSRDISSAVLVTNIDFTIPSSGELALYISTRGTPIVFDLDAPWVRSHVHVGAQGVVPPTPKFQLSQTDKENPANQTKLHCEWCQHFELTLRDRHGLAWSDFNDDGRLDVYITRGALGGTLRKFPPQVRDRVADEMLVSQPSGRFANQSHELGFRKNDCSGRHVRWTDFNRDGLLDLYVNCQDRGNVAGGYSKQLYLQSKDRRFVETASSVGLDIPNYQLIDFAWLDADGDGDADLLTHEDQGFFLYIQKAGHFTRHFIHRGPFERADIKELKGNTDDYWQFDGKLSLADFDNDGDLDVFSASKKGNVLLRNEKGLFKAEKPESLGLPNKSIAAIWVDYDNDGRQDLHSIPHGLLHQEQDGHFETSDIFALSENRYQAAFIHWFDMDNDGKQDVLMAIQDNASLWRWWEKPFKSKDVKGKDDRFRWKLLGFRNVGAKGHWLQVKLRGLSVNREAIGARVTLVSPAGRQVREVGSNESSYFSQGHYRQYFGLGDQAAINVLEINWPDGRTQKITNVKPDQLMMVSEDVTE